MDAQPLHLVRISLVIVGIGLMLFSLGAISAWSWAAMKSLRVRPPAWIIAVTAAAGASIVASLFLGGSWLSAITTTVFFAVLVGSQLRIDPFAGRSGREAP